MKSKEKYIQEIMGLANGLPEFKKSASQWAVCHWNLVKFLCEGDSPLPAREFETEIKKAIDTQDHVYYALLIYLQMASETAEGEKAKSKE